MSEHYTLPLFPLNTVLFPGMMLPLHIFEERYKDMMSYCLSNSTPFGVILLRSGRAEGPLGDIHTVGTVADITQVKRLEGGRMNIVSLGSRRFRLLDVHHDLDYLTATVEDFPLEGKSSGPTLQYARHVMNRLAKYLRAFKKMGKVNLDIQSFPTDPETLAFLTAIVLPISNEEKQDLLAIRDAETMLREELELLRHEANILEILANERAVKQNDLSSFSLN